MEFTGERPTSEHEIATSRARYKVILPYCANKRLLDFGCGIGHGTYLLSTYAESAVGYDNVPECILEARQRFQRGNLAFTNNWETTLQAAGNNLDMVVSVECIEHLEKDDLVTFLAKCSQYADTFVATTPSGDLFPYRPSTVEERIGFHVWHYTYTELTELFRKFYSFVDIQGHAIDLDIIKHYEEHGTRARGDFTGYTIFATNSFRGWDEVTCVTSPKIPPLRTL